MAQSATGGATQEPKDHHDGGDWRRVAIIASASLAALGLVAAVLTAVLYPLADVDPDFGNSGIGKTITVLQVIMTPFLLGAITFAILGVSKAPAR